MATNITIYMNICALPMMLSYLLYSGELGIARNRKRAATTLVEAGVDRCATVPGSFIAALWIPGAKTEKVAKKWRKNERKWARYSRSKRVRAALLKSRLL